MGVTVYKAEYTYVPMSRELIEFLQGNLSDYEEGSGVRYLTEPTTDVAADLIDACPDELKAELRSVINEHGGHDLSFVL